MVPINQRLLKVLKIKMVFVLRYTVTIGEKLCVVCDQNSGSLGKVLHLHNGSTKIPPTDGVPTLNSASRGLIEMWAAMQRTESKQEPNEKRE